jgi:hypothetical protein
MKSQKEVGCCQPRAVTPWKKKKICKIYISDFVKSYFIKNTVSVKGGGGRYIIFNPNTWQECFPNLSEKQRLAL